MTNEADKPVIERLMDELEYAVLARCQGYGSNARIKECRERLASEAAPAAQPAQEPKHRPSQEWYANMIAATLDDDFTIGHRTAAAQPIYWRHRKTGGVYRLVGHAQLQTDSPLVDMANVTVYQGEDGKLWARASGECGSRFDRVDAPPAAAQPATPLREVLSDEPAKFDAAYERHLRDTMPPMDAAGQMLWHFQAGWQAFRRALLAASSDEDRKLMEQALEAMVALNEWDKSRNFLVPYRIRDPIHFAIDALRSRLDGEKT